MKNTQKDLKNHNKTKLKTKNFKIILSFVLIALLISCKKESKQTNELVNEKRLPNIVFIYADDLGYGDLSAYGATELSTPNIDKLANKGIKFTNGYATSATCTPSRFALLTGTYPWRNKNAKILPGTAPLLIDTTQLYDLSSDIGETSDLALKMPYKVHELAKIIESCRTESNVFKFKK